MAKFGHLYVWFMIVVAAMAGIPRLLLSRRFAELQQAKMQQAKSLSRTNLMTIMGVLLALFFAGLYFTPAGHEMWVPVAIVFSLLSAAEYFFQARFSSLDALIFQNRLLGILYLGLSAGSYVTLSHF